VLYLVIVNRCNSFILEVKNIYYDINIEQWYNVEICCILTQISFTRNLVIVVSVTTCRGWGHIVTTPQQVTQIVIIQTDICIMVGSYVYFDSILCQLDTVTVSLREEMKFWGSFRSHNGIIIFGGDTRVCTVLSALLVSIAMMMMISVKTVGCRFDVWERWSETRSLQTMK